jgi:molybdopterin converting factor subunit 1
VTVRVLYFAVIRERLHLDVELVELPVGATLDALVTELVRLHDVLGGLLAVCKVAVNQEFAGGDRVLLDGDEVALIPPVAGG